MKPDNRPVEPAKKKAGRWIINLLIVILLAVFLYSGYKIYDIYSVYSENRKLQTEIQNIFYEHEKDVAVIEQDESTEVSDNDNEISEVQRKNPLEPIQAINEEVVAWIKIEDTVIDYPVLQCKNNDFYLDHDIYKEYTACGSIFMDCRNDMEMSNIIIYGHRMNDESMFGELIQFTKEEFFNEHPSFTLITEDTVYQCEIFAAYKTTTEFEYYQVDFSSDAEFLEYIDECRARSKYIRNVDIAAGDQILTLSTCDSTLDVNKGRLVVQAKLIPVTE